MNILGHIATEPDESITYSNKSKKSKSNKSKVRFNQQSTEPVAEPEPEPVIETELLKEYDGDGYLPVLEPVAQTKIAALVPSTVSVECTRAWYLMCQQFYKNCPLHPLFAASKPLTLERFKRGELNHIRWMNGNVTSKTMFDSYETLNTKRLHLKQVWDNNIYGQYINENNILV